MNCERNMWGKVFVFFNVEWNRYGDDSRQMAVKRYFLLSFAKVWHLLLPNDKYLCNNIGKVYSAWVSVTDYYPEEVKNKVMKIQITKQGFFLLFVYRYIIFGLDLIISILHLRRAKIHESVSNSTDNISKRKNWRESQKKKNAHFQNQQAKESVLIFPFTCTTNIFTRQFSYKEWWLLWYLWSKLISSE